MTAATSQIFLAGSFFVADSFRESTGSTAASSSPSTPVSPLKS